MHLNIRTLGSLGLLCGLVAAANAYGNAMGGVDDQVMVDSTGADITWFTEPLDANEQADLTGSGSAGGTLTMNNPPSGGTYYNTNSYAMVATYGTAYELSEEGQYYYFTNAGASAESVSLSWQGYITSTCTVSGPGVTQAYDYTESYLLDAETDVYVEDLQYQTSSEPVTTWSQFGSGNYTFSVGAGQTYQLDTGALNEAEVLATPEPAPFLALGLGLLCIRRRRSN
jgi:hypothetical protein